MPKTFSLSATSTKPINLFKAMKKEPLGALPWQVAATIFSYLKASGEAASKKMSSTIPLKEQGGREDNAGFDGETATVKVGETGAQRKTIAAIDEQTPPQTQGDLSDVNMVTSKMPMNASLAPISQDLALPNQACRSFWS